MQFLDITFSTIYVRRTLYLKCDSAVTYFLGNGNGIIIMIWKKI